MANTVTPRLRDMRRADFTRFLQLVEEREPVFKEALDAANNMVKESFFHHTPRADTVLGSPQHLTPSLPLNLDNREEASPINPRYIGQLQGEDACSGADLDALLAYSFRNAAEDQQPRSILNQCHLWQSTWFDDLEGLDEESSWFPRLQHSHQRPLRYHMLPFYSGDRWHLAIFDIVNNVASCYDTMWTVGLPNATFQVNQLL